MTDILKLLGTNTAELAFVKYILEMHQWHLNRYKM